MLKGSYTTEEIAQMLKVSKLTVYDLIKKGKLPAYRVGKQMRIDASDLEAYKHKNKTASTVPVFTKPSPSPQRSVVISGQDISLDILGRHLDQKQNWRSLRSYHGSLNSLISMYQNEGDIVSVHLYDGETGEYNLPYINRILTGRSYLVINLLSRQAGFYVQENNPKKLYDWSDLGKEGLTIVNREIGSGARVLLDEKLKSHHIHYQKLQGYEHEETSHLSVASAVKQKRADVGIGIEKAAKTVGTEFVPLIEERYDLVLLKKEENIELIKQTLSVLKSTSFQEEIAALGGYNVAQTGEVLFER
ncbi:helix-turn-helix transcriptional regulator [Shouchella patagoniensis]|uniref:helix-turn-helix transcriptional regulator n=1 Tax=Shouchella patagoniensis TaxID=228576 RepID=UPI000994BD83|nr:helix-turn-helix transcriptional regulator [Shouchella patagoniensis]